MAKPLPEALRKKRTDELLEMIAEGKSIRDAAKECGLSKSTVCRTLLDSNKYDQALEIRAMQHVDDMRLYMTDLIQGEMRPDVFREVKDAIKWIAGKEMSNRYGDRREVELKVKDIGQVLDELPNE